MFKTYYPLSRPTVLLVEDSAYLRNLLCNILKSTYQVFTASNGLEALAMIKTQMPDLIITDLLMPHVDGFELVKNLKTSGLYKHIPILVISACLGDETERLAGSGISDIIAKPFNPETLLNKISNTLAGLQEVAQASA